MSDREAANGTMSPPPPRKPQGFAAMPREKVRELAKKGGKAVQEAGTGHQFTREEARIAGRKGGLVTNGKRRAKR